MKIKIGTRGSLLAMAQTTWVMRQLERTYPEHTFELVVIKTKGDQIQDRPLDKIGDKGIFVKEIEQQILDGAIDMGVHSMKDMPSSTPEGLIFTKTWRKEDARDVLILKKGKSIADLSFHAVIATGSKRRSFQLQQLRPDIKIIGIRGNIDSRMKKMQEGDMDGLVMAAAGLHRLGLHDQIAHYFDIEQIVPACAQGALAIEIQESNHLLKCMLDTLSDEESDQCVQAERHFLFLVNGGCHIPVGAHCKKQGDLYEMVAVLGDEQTDICLKEKMMGEDPMKLAEALAIQLQHKVGKQHG